MGIKVVSSKHQNFLIFLRSFLLKTFNFLLLVSQMAMATVRAVISINIIHEHHYFQLIKLMSIKDAACD